jgi:hypothetical protein
VLSAPAIRVRRSIQADRGSPQIDAAVDAAFSGSFSGPFFLRAILISAGDRGKILATYGYDLHQKSLVAKPTLISKKQK